MHVLLPFSLMALSLSVVVPIDPVERMTASARMESLDVASAAVSGPPAICLPLEVSGRTLSWGDGGLTPPKDYPLKKLRGDLLELLESEGTLTRMENLRRAAISLGPLHRGVDVREQAVIRVEILSSLRNRALRAMLDTEHASYAAQCIFDLGYLQAALTQVGGKKVSSAAEPDFGDGAAELQYAGKASPKDGAVALGMALGLFDMRGGRADLAQFMHCAKLAGSDPELRKNLKTAAHHFLGQGDYDELVRSMAK